MLTEDYGWLQRRTFIRFEDPEFKREVPNSSAQASMEQLKLDKCSSEGWLAPAQCPINSTLRVRHIERGQATLPNLQSTYLSRFNET